MLSAVDPHIIALLLLSVFVHFDASSLLFFFFFLLPIILCVLVQVSAVERRSCHRLSMPRPAHTLHIYYITCISLQFVNCDFVVLSCKSDIFYYCGCFFPLVKMFFLSQPGRFFPQDRLLSLLRRRDCDFKASQIKLLDLDSCVRDKITSRRQQTTIVLYFTKVIFKHDFYHCGILF